MSMEKGMMMVVLMLMASASVLVKDLIFEKPTEHLIHAMKETGSKVYLYSFAWQSPNQRLGAPHCIDLPFMFGNLDD